MNPRPRPNRATNLIFNALVRTTGRRHRLPYRLFWQRLYERSRSWTMPVATRIHNRPVVLNFNYTYPIFSRQFRSLNNPLVELVYQAFRALGRPVRFMDVGAAIGDTVLLVEANCPGMVSEFICIDGDAEFFAYLENNLAPLPNCRRILHLLSSSRRQERALVRTHGGTASAQGAHTVAAAPLDDVSTLHGVGPVDVLKIDVDGFDGEVLAGATRMLGEQQPAVIFEWHPKLCQRTGNNPFHGFEALRESGYERLLWYTKFGVFSHYGTTDDQAGLLRWQRHCLSTTLDDDCHFDVVAIPKSKPLDEQALADLSYALRKPSPC